MTMKISFERARVFRYTLWFSKITFSITYNKMVKLTMLVLYYSFNFLDSCHKTYSSAVKQSFDCGTVDCRVALCWPLVTPREQFVT